MKYKATISEILLWMLIVAVLSTIFSQCSAKKIAQSHSYDFAAFYGGVETSTKGDSVFMKLASDQAKIILTQHQLSGDKIIVITSTRQ